MLAFHEGSLAGRALDVVKAGKRLSRGDVLLLRDLVQQADLPPQLAQRQARALAVVEQGVGHVLTKGDVVVLQDLVLHPDLPATLRERRD